MLPGLALTLLVFRIAAANDVNASFAADDFAVRANPLDASADLHRSTSSTQWFSQGKADEYRNENRNLSRALGN